MLALQEQFSGEVAARMAAAATALAEAGQADWGARLDACVTAGFGSYRELHDLHEVLFHHAHPARSDPDAATLVIRDLLAAGVAAGALDVSDPEATAVLCYASVRAFDLRGHGGPDEHQAHAGRASSWSRRAGPAYPSDTALSRHCPARTRRRPRSLSGARDAGRRHGPTARMRSGRLAVADQLPF